MMPSKADEESKTGLSFSTIPRYRSVMTTVNTINATGVLVAVKDGANNYSIYPVGATIKQWRDAGSTSIWPQTLKSIVVKWDGGR